MSVGFQISYINDFRSDCTSLTLPPFHTHTHMHAQSSKKNKLESLLSPPVTTKRLSLSLTQSGGGAAAYQWRLHNIVHRLQKPNIGGEWRRMVCFNIIYIRVGIINCSSIHIITYPRRLAVVHGRLRRFTCIIIYQEVNLYRRTYTMAFNVII